MTSARQTNSDTAHPTKITAAQKYIRHFPVLAADFLASNHDPVDLLRRACLLEKKNYYRVMSPGSDDEDDDDGDDKNSHSSPHRKLSSNSRSGITSSSSAFSVSGSCDGPSSVLWVKPETGSSYTVEVTILPQSNDLIKKEAVRAGQMVDKNLSGIERARYNGGPIPIRGTIDLRCALNLSDLRLERMPRRTFYVVDDLPYGDAVLGHSDPPGSPGFHGSDHPFDQDSRQVSDEYPHVVEFPQHIHDGSRMQQAPYTHSQTENSTATTAKRTSATNVGLGARERRQSAASDSSKIPVPRSSRHNVGSASVGHSRKPTSHSAHEPPAIPPGTQTGLTSGFLVTILCGKSEMGFKLELDAPGASFFESLNGFITKKRRKELDREMEDVCFTYDRDTRGRCCWVSLKEDQVEHDWSVAVDWFNRTKQEPPHKVYAVIGAEAD